jgi:hypothetical protein
MALVHEPTTPRRTRIVAFAALAAVALVAAAVIALGGGDDKTIRSPSRGNSQQTGKDAPSETLTAENVKFSDVYGAQIPSSAAGPKETAGGRALGFERSPAGAVLAAINIFARAESRPGPGVFEPTITEQVTGPDKDKLLCRREPAPANGLNRHAHLRQLRRDREVDRGRLAPSCSSERRVLGGRAAAR